MEKKFLCMATGFFVACGILACINTAGATSIGYGSCESLAYIGSDPGATMAYGQSDGETHGPDSEPFSIKADDHKWWASPGYDFMLSPPASLGYASLTVDPGGNSISARAAANGYSMPGGRGYAFGYIKGLYEVTSDTYEIGDNVEIAADITLGGRFVVEENTLGTPTWGTPTWSREMLSLTRLPNRVGDDWGDPDYFISDSYYLDYIPPIMYEPMPGYLGHIYLEQEPASENFDTIGTPVNSIINSYYAVSSNDMYEDVSDSADISVDVEIGDIIMMETMLEVWATSDRSIDGVSDEVWADFGNTLNSSIQAVTGGVDVVHYQAGDSSAPPIPEPATLFLLGTGIFGLMACKRMVFRNKTRLSE